MEKSTSKVNIGEWIRSVILCLCCFLGTLANQAARNISDRLHTVELNQIQIMTHIGITPICMNDKTITIEAVLACSDESNESKP